MDALTAWLEQFPPKTRILIVGASSGFLVLILMLMMHPAPPPPPPKVELPAETPLKHYFSQTDLQAVTNLATQVSGQMQSLDQEMSRPHANPNEPICLNGMRYSVYGYLSKNLLLLQRDVATTMRMQKAEDEALMNAAVLDTVHNTQRALPDMEYTVSSMVRGCNGSAIVWTYGNQSKSLLNQTGPLVKNLQARITQTK